MYTNPGKSKNRTKRQADPYKKFRTMTNNEMVRDFMQTFGHETPTEFTMLDEEQLKFRYRLIDEEYSEVKDAIDEKNPQEIAKELTDLLVVVYGTAIAFGVDADKTMLEVHRSNMSKLGEDGKPVYREDGKILKGPNFSKAVLTGIVK